MPEKFKYINSFALEQRTISRNITIFILGKNYIPVSVRRGSSLLVYWMESTPRHGADKVHVELKYGGILMS